MTKLSEAQKYSAETAQLIGMIYPGIQYKSQITFSRNSRYFAYATIISVYIYDQSSMNLVNIISTGKDSISAISFASKSIELIAVSYNSQKVQIVNFIENILITEFQSPEVILNFGWSNNDTQVICFTKFFYRYYLFDVFTGEKIKTSLGSFQNIRILAVSDPDNPTYFGGNNVGTLTWIRNTKCKSIEFPTKYKVVSVVIDPNSNYQCLVVWKYSWGIFDISAGISLMHEVNDLNYSIASASWSCVPGQFITGDESTGIIRIWNASSISPLDVISVYSCGIASILDLKHDRLLICFEDGMIGVFDMRIRHFIFQNLGGHINTIFSIQFYPTNPDVFVTAGGEGVICTWNASTMRRIDRLVPQDPITGLFSMDVSLGGGMICCGYKEGRIAFFSLQTKTKINDTTLTNKRIVSVKFSIFEPEQLIVSSDDGFCAVYDVQRNQILWQPNLQLIPNIGFFSIHNKGQILVTCHNGSVLIYNSIQSTEPDLVLEDPMKSDLYFLAFSPFDKNIFATTDNDGCVKLWNISTRTVEVIGLHNGKSRPICFHPTIDYIICSGGYDKQIMIHDIKAKCVICSFEAHTTFVQAIAFSPANPNLLISAAADSTIRFWSIDTLFMKTALINIMDKKYDWIRPLESHQQLLKLVRRCMKLDDRIQFNASDVMHINDILRVTKKGVQKSLSATSHETRLITRAIKAKERMINAAQTELYMGNPKHYCELLFTAGEFDRAVAAAPAVSVNFWIEMIKNRAKLLDDENEIANLKLIIGQVEEASEILLNANETEKAFLISAAKNNGSFNFTSRNGYHQALNIKRPYIDTNFEIPALYTEYRTASLQAQQSLKDGHIFLAAGAFLSVGDILSTEYLLLKHGQTAAAYLVDSITNTNNPEVKDRFYMLAIQSGLKNALFERLTEEEKLKYVITIHFKSEAKRIAFYEKHGLKKPSEYSGGDTDMEKIINMLLAGKQNDASEFLIKIAQEKIRSDYTYIETLFKFFQKADFTNASDRRYFTIVALSLYFAFYRALWKGYKRILRIISQKLHEIVEKHELDWLAEYVTETNNAVNLFYEKMTGSRIFYVGYKFFNPNPIGTPYTKEQMYGKRYFLEDGDSTIDMESALMWFDITPFSPLTFKCRHYII